MKVKLIGSDEVLKVVSFAEFLGYGVLSKAPLINGMPWSFDWNGFSVTHENDLLYILSRQDERIVFPITSVLLCSIYGKVTVQPINELFEQYEVLTGFFNLMLD